VKKKQPKNKKKLSTVNSKKQGHLTPSGKVNLETSGTKKEKKK